MAWRDLSDEERAEVKADAWAFLAALFGGLCALGVWYYYGRTG